MTDLATSNSTVVVRLCSHMDPRGAILLDEKIHILDCALCYVPVWYGGQCIVHLGAGGKAANKGTFLKCRE